MPDAETHFHDIGGAIAGAAASQMFGKKCYKKGGKAFVRYFEDCMVFKLPAEPHAAAMSLSGAKLFDPSGKGRPMKEWVQVPHSHHARWAQFATAASSYVAGP